MVEKLIASVLLCAFALPIAALADTNITAVGSSALLPLVKQSAQDYQVKHPDVKISVSGGGSFVGIAQAQNGNADMGDSDVIAPGASGLIDHKVAVVGFGVIANPSSGVTNLKAAQIRDIFAGRIANWKGVGGKDQPIVVINRPRTSGTRYVFTATLMGTSKIAESGLTEDSSGTVVKTVSSTPGSVSYVALGYTKDQPVSVLKINGVDAGAGNIRTGKYGVWSYEHIFTKTKNPSVEDFIAFISQNTDALEKLGYIKISTMKVHELNR
ncbi:MAG: phosphate ABC transporter substrate-binding protein [Candidatus Baltobacteraceae bacterium]